MASQDERDYEEEAYNRALEREEATCPNCGCVDDGELEACECHCHSYMRNSYTPNRQNPYTVGSLLWVERNLRNAERDILDAVLARTMTVEEGRQAIHALDSDSASY